MKKNNPDWGLHRNKKSLVKCDNCKKLFFFHCLNLRIIQVEGKTKGITVCDTCDKLQG